MKRVCVERERDIYIYDMGCNTWIYWRKGEKQREKIQKKPTEIVKVMPLNINPLCFCFRT